MYILHIFAYFFHIFANLFLFIQLQSYSFIDSSQRNYFKIYLPSYLMNFDTISYILDNTCIQSPTHIHHLLIYHRFSFFGMTNEHTRRSMIN